MKFELKRIAVWPAVKISFLVNLVLGFIIGIFYAFFLALLMALPTAMADPNFAPFSAISGAILVLVPFLFAFGGAVMYTIAVFIFVIVYNLFAKIAGGMEFEYVQLAEIKPVATPAVLTSTAPAAPPVQQPEAERPATPHSPFTQPHQEPPQDNSV